MNDNIQDCRYVFAKMVEQINLENKIREEEIEEDRRNNGQFGVGA